MPTTVTPVLAADDRCDRCGAQAYVLVRLHSGLDLQFCVHHYTAHSQALQPLVLEVVDESSRLFEATAR
ncbi:MAG: hypothetical protein V9E98_15620 [Candidatus Nanopelagicales bacterium]